MLRGGLLALFLLAAPALVGWQAAPVWAADEPHAAGVGGGHAGEGQGGGAHEDTNIFRPAIELGIWTLAVFVILLLVLRVLAWKPMLEGLQKREQNIRSAIDEAKAAREEAHRMREQWQREMDQANAKVRDLLNEGRQHAEKMQEEMIAKARTEIQGERDRLHREIDIAKDQALQQLWSQTAQLAAAISSKAIRRQLGPDDHRRLVDEALAEIRQAGEDMQGA